MFILPYRRKQDIWLTASPRLDAATTRCVEVATARAATAMRAGNLLSSYEAMLMAGPEARRRETLYSIARATAGEIGGDLEELLGVLERRFRGWR
jgi:hypothetical protein